MNINTSWKPEYAVRWHEGMFLLPAHYQITDRRNEFLLAQRFAAALPLAWGVIRQQLDVSQLGSGVLRILELEAVMPDGLYVHYSQPATGDAVPVQRTEPLLEIKLDKLQETPNAVQTVWFTVPHASSNPTNDFENLRHRDVEFSLIEPSTEEAQPIPLLAPNPSLQLGDPPSRFAALPIARTVFRPEGYCLLDYEPPQLLIRRGSRIFTLLLDLVTAVRNLAASLIRRDEETFSQDHGSRFEPHLILPGLMGHLPMLETFLFSESVSPLMLFGALSNLAGSICSIGHLTTPKRIDFDHYDPLRCFTRLVEEIRLEMELRIPTRHREIPFSQEEENFSLSSRWLSKEGTVLIGVAMRAGADEEKAVRWFEHAVIGFDDEIEPLILRRSVGAQRKKTSVKGSFTLSRRMLFWEVSLASPPANDAPLRIVGVSETERMSRPAAVYLLQTVRESNGSFLAAAESRIDDSPVVVRSKTETTSNFSNAEKPTEPNGKREDV